jgi:Flp pilus assembly protein TadG
MTLCRTVRMWSHDKSGVAAIEMALVAPALVLLFCGGGEIAMYARAAFQTSQMASTVADAVSRYESITSSDIASIFSVSSDIMGNNDFAANGYVVLSSVSRTAGATPKVIWQCKGGGLASTSKVGQITKDATLPNNLVLDSTDNVIVAEVFYKYSPMFSKVLTVDSNFYKTAVFRPRLGDLTSVPGC